MGVYFLRITFILIFLIAGNLYSFDHGLITGFETRYNLNNILIHNTMNDSGKVSKNVVKGFNESLTIMLLTGYRIGNLRLIGEYTNIVYPLEIDSFNPVQDTYRVNVSYRFIDSLELGFNHQCSHPVMTNGNLKDSWFDSAQRYVYLRFYKEF